MADPLTNTADAATNVLLSGNDPAIAALLLFNLFQAVIIVVLWRDSKESRKFLNSIQVKFIA